MRSGLAGLFRLLASRGRKLLRPPADRVLDVHAPDDALKPRWAVLLRVCGAGLRQKIADGLAVLRGLGLKADHRVRVLGEFFQQVVCRLFIAHVPIVVPRVPLFKLATRAAMRHMLSGRDSNHDWPSESSHDLHHEPDHD